MNIDALAVLDTTSLGDAELEAVSMHSSMRFRRFWEAGAVFDEGEHRSELVEAAALLFIYWSHIKSEKRLGFVQRLVFKRIWGQVEKSLIGASLTVEVIKRARAILEERAGSFGSLSASAGRVMLRVAPTLNESKMERLAKESLYALARLE